MAFIFIDLLKQADAIAGLDNKKYNIAMRAEPEDGSSQKSNFVVFGSYDWLHYGGFPESLSKLKEQHESRHMLSWQYERQPMFLYCRDGDKKGVADIFSASDRPEHPLVLSLIQIDKAQISKLSCRIDAFLGNIRNQIKSIEDDQIRFEVCWNLGGSDVVIVFRTQSLAPVAQALFSIQTQGFRVDGNDPKTIPAFSSSSHCALAIHDPAIGVSEDVVEKWLRADQSAVFRALFETTSGHNGLIRHEKSDIYFILGERDYEIPFPEDRTDWAKMLARFLNPVLKDGDIYHNHASFIMPEVKIGEKPNELAPADGLTWLPENNRAFETLDSIRALLGEADFAYGQSFKSQQSQLEHCRNSLLGLYKYAYRLRATIGQYNLFCYVRRLYRALEDTFQCYREALEGIINDTINIDARPRRFRVLLSELTKQTFMVVSELQHLFSVLAVSTHTYMETYSSSMRSLNAASKLWDAYNGIILTLTDIFPPRQHEIDRKITIMLSPYRERQSENIELFPRESYTHPIVLIQMNFALMFDTRLATYMLVHECGHHLSDSCRDVRFELMTKAMISAILKEVYDYFVLTPLYMLTTISSNSEPDVQGYLDLLRKKDKTCDDYKALLALKVHLDAGEEYRYRELFDKYHAQLKAAYETSVRAAINDMFEDYQASYVNSSGRGNPKYDHYYGEELLSAYRYFIPYKLQRIINSLGELRKILHDDGLDILRTMIRDLPAIDQYQVSHIKAFLGFEHNAQAVEDKLLNMIQNRVPSALSEEILTIFREVHADMFTVIVLGMRYDEYLGSLNKFADQHPPLLASPVNLWRILVVSSVAFPNEPALESWIDGDACAYADDVKKIAVSDIAYLRDSPMLLYVMEYAQEVKKQLEEKANGYSSGSKEFGFIRDMYRKSRNSRDCTDAIWHFWIRSMSDGMGEVRSADEQKT